MAGIYIHIPFCIRKCPYCDFYSVAGAEKLLPFFVRAVQDELELVSREFPLGEIRTVYFGGGTPSLLSGREISGILEGIGRFYGRRTDAEISLEANPGSIAPAKLREFREAGVNRLSIGGQSFHPRELEVLGRIHSVDDISKTVEHARSAGFDNLGLDLIFGLPGQELEAWRASVKRALDLQPDHISAYALTWSKDTPMGRNIASGALPEPEENTVSEMLLWTDEFLSEAGYHHYEISNFARPGFECLHNLNYWSGTAYLGLGPSAHSFVDGKRFWNAASLERYLEYVGKEQSAREGEETLTPSEKRLEALSLGLRRSSGIPLSIVMDKMAEIHEMENRGFGQIRDGRFLPTARGFLLADELAGRLA